MQCIITKFIPATTSKPARIKATSSQGVSVTIPYNADRTYWQAAQTLRDKLGWKGTMIEGATNNGAVYVFASGKQYGE